MGVTLCVVHVPRLLNATRWPLAIETGWNWRTKVFAAPNWIGRLLWVDGRKAEIAEESGYPALVAVIYSIAPMHEAAVVQQ